MSQNQSNNVISFPNQSKQITVEEIDDRIEMVKLYHIQETVSAIVPSLFNQLEIAGFNIDEESGQGLKNGAFLIETLRSIMCEQYGIYHPFQTITQNVFIPDDTDLSSLQIAEKLNISLKEEKAITGE